MTRTDEQSPAAEFAHRSVLLDVAVGELVTRADGRYVDGTFGRGGHSRLILGHLDADGRLLGTSGP